MRALLIVVLLSAPALAKEKGERVQRPLYASPAIVAIAKKPVGELGVWNFKDHFKQGHVEAGLQMHSDLINVKVSSRHGSRRYYVFRDLAGGTPALRAIIDVPRRGKVRLQISPESGWAGSPESVLEYLRTALGEYKLKPKQLP